MFSSVGAANSAGFTAGEPPDRKEAADERGGVTGDRAAVVEDGVVAVVVMAPAERGIGVLGREMLTGDRMAEGVLLRSCSRVV